MSFSLEKAIFINRAPFEHLELDFKKQSVNVLSSVNGKGKTTILSHIVDALYEMARPNYTNSFEGKEYKYYRISTPLFSIVESKYSIVYFRFKYDDKLIDYLDCRSKNITEDEYRSEISLDNPINFMKFKEVLKENGCVKIFSETLQKDIVQSIFNKNVLTYFPAYRYEQPFYLNEPYEISTKFHLESSYNGDMVNPLEVRTEIKDLANWIMDVVLDWINYKEEKEIETSNGIKEKIDVTPERIIFNNLNLILKSTLSSKYPDKNIRYGIGKRYSGDKRISIMHYGDAKGLYTISPNIFCLSSGELSLISLFSEILRQGDNLAYGIELKKITGIVLIDEVDMHLHITLQNKILPMLFNLFPNVQFIVSSHSPFLNMGLADQIMDRTQIIDLDNNGISCSPTNNDLYKEVYELMINENNQYAKKYKNLIAEIEKNSKPIIITEGETDYRHIQNAMKVLKRTDVDVIFYEIQSDWGDSKLRTLLDNLSKIKQKNKIIGIFDRDSDVCLKYLDVDTQSYKTFGESNVYAFAIPLVNEESYGSSISIEHYYKKENLLSEDLKTHRRLFLGSEFYISGNSKDANYQTKISNIKHKVELNGIIDKKVYSSTDLEQKTNIAMSKDAFVSLIETDKEYVANFDFSNFNKILDIIQDIVSLPLY